MRVHMYSVQVYCTRTVHKCTRGAPVRYFQHFAQFWYKVQVRIRILIRLNELILSLWPSCSSLCSAVRLPPSLPPLCLEQSNWLPSGSMWHSTSIENLSAGERHTPPFIQPFSQLPVWHQLSRPPFLLPPFTGADNFTMLICAVRLKKKSCTDSINYFWYLEGFVSSPIPFARGPRSVHSDRNALYRSILTVCRQALHPFFLLFLYPCEWYWAAAAAAAAVRCLGGDATK